MQKFLKRLPWSCLNRDDNASFKLVYDEMIICEQYKVTIETIEW